MNDKIGYIWIAIIILMLIPATVTTSKTLGDCTMLTKQLWVWICFSINIGLLISLMGFSLTSGKKEGQIDALKGIQNYKMIITEKQYKTGGKYLYKTEFDTTFVEAKK